MAQEKVSDLEAAQLAEKQREEHIEQMNEFCFETVLSTERNLRLLERAKEKVYFIRCYYILTADPAINIWHVKSRVELGDHDVPERKDKHFYDECSDWYFEDIQALTNIEDIEKIYLN